MKSKHKLDWDKIRDIMDLRPSEVRYTIAYLENFPFILTMDDLKYLENLTNDDWDSVGSFEIAWNIIECFVDGKIGDILNKYFVEYYQISCLIMSNGIWSAEVYIDPDYTVLSDSELLDMNKSGKEIFGDKLSIEFYNETE